jgi:hypothetical protein
MVKMQCLRSPVWFSPTALAELRLGRKVRILFRALFSAGITLLYAPTFLLFRPSFTRPSRFVRAHFFASFHLEHQQRAFTTGVTQFLLV